MTGGRKRVQQLRLKAKDLMTKDVFTVDKDERIERVLSLMEKHAISKVPVTNDGKLVGIVTDGDLADELGALRTRHKPAQALHVTAAMQRTFKAFSPDADIEDVIEHAKQDNVGMIPIAHGDTLVGVLTKADLLKLVKSTQPVRDVMVTRLHAVEPTDRVIHARRMMLDHGVERLPVLSGGHVVGVVSEFDTALGFYKFKDKVQENHQPEALKRWFVEDIMVRNVITARPETTVAEAARTMHDKHVGCLPIVDARGKIAGMITRTDLIRTIDTA